MAPKKDNNDPGGTKPDGDTPGISSEERNKPWYKTQKARTGGKVALGLAIVTGLAFLPAFLTDQVANIMCPCVPEEYRDEACMGCSSCCSWGILLVGCCCIVLMITKYGGGK